MIGMERVKAYLLNKGIVPLISSSYSISKNYVAKLRLLLGSF